MNMLLLAGMICFLLICAAFFSGSETAITAISRAEYRNLKKTQDTQSQKTAQLVEIKDRIVTTALIGTNFVNMLNSSLTTALTLSAFGAHAVPAATVCIAVLIIITAEIFPKALATENPVRFGKHTAMPLFVCYTLLRPAVAFFSLLSALVLKLLPAAAADEPVLLEKKDLQLLVRIGQQDGAVIRGEETLLEKALLLQHLKLRSIMTPRTEIIAIAEDDSREYIIEQFQKSRFSRLPMCNAARNTIIGIVHYKDVLFSMSENAAAPVLSQVRPAVFVPDSSSLFSILKTMNRHVQNMVIAVNEHGTIAGLVTMDDIIAAVFSQVQDEYGMPKRDPMQFVSMPTPATVTMPGDLPLSDCNDLLKTSFHSNYYDTVAGFLLEKYGCLPDEGDTVICGAITFTINKIVHRRIAEITADISRVVKKT